MDKLYKHEPENVRPELELNHLQIEKIDSELIYRIHFNSVSDLEMYLSANPPVNKKIFYEQKSLTLYKEFAGENLRTSLYYLRGGYSQNLEQFISLKRSLDAVNVIKTNGRKTINSFVGGRPNVPAYIADHPKTMRRTERVSEKPFVNIMMNLAYPSSTTDAQILNRGLITLNLISLLENNNVGVSFTVFEMVENESEIFDASVDLKKSGEVLDIQKCYFPICGKEFLRRILVRVKESTPFKTNWFRGYGSVMSEEKVRELKNLSSKHIFISDPAVMGITGKDLYEDAENFFNKINLEQYINVSVR